MPFSRGFSSEVESDLVCRYSVGNGEGNASGFLGVDGEDSAEEGGLLGKIISGFVRVGDGRASASEGSWRTCILKAYGALTVFEEFAFLMHADKRNQTGQLIILVSGRERMFMMLKIR